MMWVAEKALSGLRAVVVVASWSVAFAAHAAPQPAATGDGPLYRSVGKRMAPVELVNAGEHLAQVGITMALPLELRTAVDADAVEVEIVASSGLQLATTRRRLALGAVNRGAVRLPTLAVTPLSGGRHYVTVNVFMRFAGAMRFRSFTLPVQAGPVEAAAPVAQKGQPATLGPDGRRLHVLPARERP